MSTLFQDRLDDAITRLNQDDLTYILSDHADEAEAIRPYLDIVTSLTFLQTIEQPPAAALDADRFAFYKQLDTLPQPLSPLQRLRNQISHHIPLRLNNRSEQKELKRMSNLLAKAALTLALLFGAAGGTAALATDSLPNEALYPVKLVMEDTQLAMTENAADAATLQLSFAEARLDEVVQMALAGNTPKTAVFERLESHFTAVFNLAAELPDTAMHTVLAQAQTMLQTQTTQLAQTEPQLATQMQSVFGHAYRIMDQAAAEVVTGLQEPTLFRLQHGQPDGTDPTQLGPCQNADCTQDDNGKQNGPGDGSCGDPND
ncbi:MAG: hypothetical protein KC421_27415, partial [Anaerolineales bacterium]|nr:hypothetical protein [Anaerolineales bacterium]